MEEAPRTPSRRLWLIAVAVGLLLLITAWFARPRFDRGLIGAWSDGANVMRISSGGVVDQFCMRFETFFGTSSFATGGPYQLRTSGDQFEIVYVTGPPGTLSGLVNRIVFRLLGWPLEYVKYRGRIVEVRLNAIVLEVEGRGTCQYRRVK